jgi:hypothetical protein
MKKSCLSAADLKWLKETNFSSRVSSFLRDFLRPVFGRSKMGQKK